MSWVYLERERGEYRLGILDNSWERKGVGARKKERGILLELERERGMTHTWRTFGICAVPLRRRFMGNKLTNLLFLIVVNRLSLKSESNQGSEFIKPNK